MDEADNGNFRLERVKHQDLQNGGSETHLQVGENLYKITGNSL